MKTCEVSKAAHARGYGTQDEIYVVCQKPREECVFDITAYLNTPKPIEKARRPR